MMTFRKIYAILLNMNVYFMRHGETDWNTEKRLQGTTDIPLNQNGIELAKHTAQSIFDEGVRFSRVYTSPLIRAVKTAELMAKPHKIEPIKDERITEFNFGEAEGHTFEEIKISTDFEWLKSWFLSPQDYKGGHGAENYDTFFGRLDDFLQKEIKPLEQQNIDSILIVCHGGVVRGLLKVMLNWSIEKFAQTKIPNCGMNLVTLKSGIFTLEYTARSF